MKSRLRDFPLQALESIWNHQRADLTRPSLGREQIIRGCRVRRIHDIDLHAQLLAQIPPRILAQHPELPARADEQQVWLRIDQAQYSQSPRLYRQKSTPIQQTPEPTASCARRACDRGRGGTGIPGRPHKDLAIKQQHAHAAVSLDAVVQVEAVVRACVDGCGGDGGAGVCEDVHGREVGLGVFF